MKKLLKKSLSCILALTLIISALPMFAVASESETEPTNFNAVYALSVRSKSDEKVTTTLLYTYKTADDRTNHRVSFLKFDFTGLSNEQIHKIGTASLNIYKSSQKDCYAGLKVSVLPENLENWDNLEYYVDASDMLSTSIDVVSTDEPDEGELAVGYKTVDNLGDAIAEHLISDSDDKIVCFRLEGVAEDLTTYSNHTSDNPPYISLTFDGTYRLPKATIYDGSSTRGTPYSNQEIMGKTIFTQANSSNNTRYAFYKFDFSQFSISDLCRVNDMTLNLYYYGTNPYTGVKVAVLPGEMEDWTSEKEKPNTLSSTYAHSKGMFAVPTIEIAVNSDGLNTDTKGWKPVSGLGDAIVQHLLSDTDDKIVAIRVDAYSGAAPCMYTGLSHDASIQPYISATPIEKALSDGSIIIGKETVSENVLTEVKFATTVPVADTNIKFVAASYTASNELVAVSVADVASVSADWNTASLDLSLANSAKIKYMLWSDIDTTIVPIVKVSEK